MATTDKQTISAEDLTGNSSCNWTIRSPSGTTVLVKLNDGIVSWAFRHATGMNIFASSLFCCWKLIHPDSVARYGEFGWIATVLITLEITCTLADWPLLSQFHMGWELINGRARRLPILRNTFQDRFTFHPISWTPSAKDWFADFGAS